MKRFIIYTTEGYTIAPDNTDIENCQILSFEDANSKEEARDKFFAHHQDLFKHGFSRCKVVCVEIVN